MEIQRKSINLFNDREVRCYKTVFNITNEEDLLQWWEYNMENSVEKYPESINFLHTLYRSCFHLIEQRKIHFDIIFEKSQKYVYWTIWADQDISSLQISCSQFSTSRCKTEDKRISFQLSTLACDILQAPLNITTASTLLIIYDFLEDDDMSHIIEINEELNEELVYLEGKGFCEKSINKIQKLLSEYALTLSPYKEIVHIRQSIDELSYFMNENRATLIDLDKSYISLFEGLIINLQKWFDALFVNGASSTEDFKKSICADVEIIKVMTVKSEDEGDIEFF